MYHTQVMEIGEGSEMQAMLSLLGVRKSRLPLKGTAVLNFVGFPSEHDGGSGYHPSVSIPLTGYRRYIELCT